MSLLRNLWRFITTGVMPPPQIQVLIIHVGKSTHVTAHTTLTSAQEALRGYMESFEEDAWWPEDFRLAKLADDFHGMVGAYFDDNEQESYLIQAIDVQGAPREPYGRGGASLHDDDDD